MYVTTTTSIAWTIDRQSQWYHSNGNGSTATSTSTTTTTTTGTAITISSSSSSMQLLVNSIPSCIQL